MDKCFCHFNGYEVKDAKARPFKNVNEMKSRTNLVDGNIVKTIGYYEANDGGAGTYLIREKQESDIEDNGSIHFIGDSLVAELIEDNINVKQFGAYGDGIHNDSTSIQNAIIYLKNKFNKDYETRVLYFNDGSYKIENTIILSPYVKYKANGMVSLLNYVNGACLHLTYQKDDFTGNENYISRNWLNGCMFSETGNVQIIDKSNSENSKGLEIGYNIEFYNSLNDIEKTQFTLSMTSFKNIVFTGFNYGLYIHTIHFYIVQFDNIRTVKCNTSVYIDNENIDSGENIRFTNCVFGTGNYSFNINAPLNITFNKTSFDFNKERMILTNDIWSVLTFNECHFEGYINKSITENLGGIYINNPNTSIFTCLSFNSCYSYTGGSQEGDDPIYDCIPLVNTNNKNVVKVFINNFTDINSANTLNTKHKETMYLINANVYGVNSYFSDKRMLSYNTNENLDGLFSRETLGVITALKDYNLLEPQNITSYIIENDEDLNEKVLHIIGTNDFRVTLQSKKPITDIKKGSRILYNSLMKINEGTCQLQLITRFYDINDELIGSPSYINTNVNNITGEWVHESPPNGPKIPEGTNKIEVNIRYISKNNTDIYINKPSIQIIN